MSLKPQNTYKHLFNFISKEESRPVLNGIHVTENGDLEATNSHVIIQLYGRVRKGQEMIIDPKRIRCIEGKYPSLNRIAYQNPNFEIELVNKQLVQIFNFAKSVNKDASIEIKLGNRRLEFLTKGGNNLSLSADSDDPLDMYVSQTNLKIVFDFLKDNTESISFGYSGALQPLIFDKPQDFKVLLMPIREEWSHA